jgi:aspartyl protease family protein
MFRILHFTYILLLLLLSGCSGCSQSGRRGSINVNNETEEHQNNESQNNNGEKTVVKMEKIGGVYQIPVLVNDVKMYFIFDTGASTISISETEAGFLWKQGKLTRKDIIGTANFSDANGDISEGTIILLKTIKIGRRTLNNVEASVVHNLNAPLLFGQSALGKFGKISIDNNKNEITFE